jgi:acyl-CoA dehydrogenase
MDRETRDMLLETADRFFTERCGRAVVNEVEKGVWPANLWKEIEEMGLPLIAVPEDKNGVGGTLADMLALLRLAGSHAVPVPLAETALANLLIAAAGGEPKAGPATLALGNLALSGGRVSGRSSACPSPRWPIASSPSSAARSRSLPLPTPRSTPGRVMPVNPTVR